MDDKDKESVLDHEFWGWILFLVCAILFIASSIRNGDVLALIGSILFLVGCFVFMIPLVRRFK